MKARMKHWQKECESQNEAPAEKMWRRTTRDSASRQITKEAGIETLLLTSGAINEGSRKMKRHCYSHPESIIGVDN